MSTQASYCRICSAQCGVVLEVEDGRIVGHTPDPDHPISAGYFCVKGKMAVELTGGAEDRLTQSLRKKGGSFEPIAADRALDEVAERLRAIRDQYGPEAIAFYLGTGGYQSTLGYLLMRSLVHNSGSPNLFTTFTIDQSAKLVAKCRTGLMRSGTRTLAEADVAMIVGSNPVISHQGSSTAANRPRQHYRAFRERGGKLIVIDPRRTETAQFADLFLQPFPGEDATLFAALIKHVLDNEWHDVDFCDRFVGDLARLRAAVAPFDLAYAAQRCGVSEADLAEAARQISSANFPMVTCGTGPNMGRGSNLAVHLIDALQIICGGYRKAGERVPNPGALMPRTFAESAVASNRTWESGPRLATSKAGQLLGEFPTALMPTEILGTDESRIRALIVFGGNPAMAIGDPEVTSHALGQLDLLVTLDPRMSQTASLSDYVIATSTIYERHDLTMHSDQQAPQPFAQLATPVVPKPREVIDDWEVFWGLAARLGLPMQLRWANIAQDFAGAPGIDLDLNSVPSAESLMRALCDLGEVPYEVLAAHPQGWMPQPAPSVEVAEGEPNGVRLELCPSDVEAEIAATRTLAPQAPGLRLSVRRLLHTQNSAFVCAEPTRKRYPTNYAYLNPEEMAAQGLAKGDSVSLSNHNGAIEAVVLPDAEVRQGVVSMSHLWGSIPTSTGKHFPGANTGRLVSPTELEDINFMPTFTGIEVHLSSHGEPRRDEP